MKLKAAKWKKKKIKRLKTTE